MNNRLGYVICETSMGQDLPKMERLTEKQLSNTFTDLPPWAYNKNRVVAQVTFQRANEKNRNGRWYDRGELFPELKSKRITELIKTGNLKCESGHPLAKDLQRQQTIVEKNCPAMILKFWTDGDFVKGLVRGTNNDLGEEFNNDLLDGMSPSWSLRALGSVDNTRRGAEVKGIKIITYDKVVFPSHPDAYTDGIVSMGESSSIWTPENDDPGFMFPVTNQDVIDCIKQESYSYKKIEESFDVLYESMQLVNNGSDVQLMDREGNVYVITLENHIQNEIMNYCYNS